MCIAILLAASGQASAAPGDILFQDNFERSNPGVVGNGWTVTAAAGACTGVASTVVPAVYPTATITVAGSQQVPVNGITVGGQQIMAASYAGNTSPSTVTSNIRTQINACTAAITGNCTVAGYSATRSGSVVTITGPSTATGSPVVALGTPSGTGTTETFTATAFTAYTPATTTGGNTGCAGIDADTPPWNSTTLPLAPRANDNSRTMFTRWATVTVDTPVIDLSGKPAAQVTYWVRRGSDCFSEWPGNNQAGCNAALTPFTSLLGEEFQTQYKNSAGTWVVLSQYPTDAIPGEIFRPVIDLPADALHANFQLRFRQPSGSGFNGTNGGASGVLGYDYWHVDDVKITEMAATNYVGAFCDTFEGDLSRWTFTGTGNAAIGSRYFQNGAHDLDIRWGPVTVTSKPTDMTGATGKIEYWIKRGTGNVTTVPNTTGSDLPDTGKDLVVEYLTTTAGVWKALVPAATFAGGGAGGQVWTPVANSSTNSIAIPADANRSGFQLRFRLLAGAGYDQDYWHVDDVCLGTVITGTDLILTMAPTGTTTLAPGATSTITFTVTNNGPNVEPGAISITDTLPAGLSFVSSGSWSSGSLLPGATSACTSVGQVLTCTRVGTLGVLASTTLTITVQADANASGTVTNSARVAGQSLETVPADNTKTNSYSFAPAAFKAYETSTATGALTGRIYSKLAGTPFNLKVIAINAGAINATYNKSVTVDLIDGGAASCVSAIPLAGVAVSSTSPAFTATPYTYVAADGGVHIFTFTSAYAYRDAQVRIKDNVSTDCTSDHFAIRPSAFTITSTNATNTGASGVPAIKAGAAFNLTASSAAGYDGKPIIDNTAGMVLGTPSAGTLNGAFSVAPVATGIAAGASFTYSEVGNFGLAANAVYDSTFTLLDQPGDCIGSSSSNILANGQYGCTIGSVAVAQATGSSGFGRFIPDHFDTAIVLTAGVPMACPAGLTCPTSYNGFVYSGQPFTTQVTARNLSNTTTLNYDSAPGYSRAVTLSAWDAVGGTNANPGGGALALNTVLATAFSLGVASTNTPSYSFPATPVAPADIYIRAAESFGGDGVTSQRGASSVEGGIKVVSGRIKISNTHGSELLPLPATATVQYWNGSNYVTSNTDSLTTFYNTNVVFSNWQKNINTVNYPNSGATSVTPASVMFTNGVGSFKLSAPGAGKNGSVDLTTNAPTYLPSTTGRATFGVYKGKNEFIFLRENY